MTPLSTITLSSTAASVTFSSISQGFTELVLVVSFQTSLSESNQSMVLEVNGNTTLSNYSANSLYATTSTASCSYYSNTTANAKYITRSAGASSTAGLMQATTSFTNYTDLSDPKYYITHSGHYGAKSVVGSRFSSNSAITSLKLFLTGSALFGIGSEFSLYGVRA